MYLKVHIFQLKCFNQPCQSQCFNWYNSIMYGYFYLCIFMHLVYLLIYTILLDVRLFLLIVLFWLSLNIENVCMELRQIISILEIKNEVVLLLCYLMDSTEKNGINILCSWKFLCSMSNFNCDVNHMQLSFNLNMSVLIHTISTLNIEYCLRVINDQ